MISLKNLKELSENFSVLYVEDDIAIQTTMRRYLKKFFSTLVVACDGEEGLNFYKKENFDIVITDLSMPKMNGADMIKSIKEINENQSVLITTAYSESQHLYSAFKMGVDGYIIKPFDMEQLNQELYKIVNKLKKFQENEIYKKQLKEMVEQKTSELNATIKYQHYNYEKTLLSMVEMIEERDTYTAGHSKRVAEYCKIIAKQMGYDDADCTKIYQAGILHDIGKVATPDSVLLNPKTLSGIEYKLIQEHVEVSYKLLSHIPMFTYLADIVKSHHERYDGKGYPRGLSKDEIAPLSRIMIVADAFDAMTTNRIYKARKSVNEALKELAQLSSKQFHPEVVESALIALKNISIDSNISQIPRTKLERERFSYFYKDTLSDVYNQNYLDISLMKNKISKEFRHLYIFNLENFSQYNKKYSWQEGDKLLRNFANCLDNYFAYSDVFRIFGDDFVVMSAKEDDVDKLLPLLDELVRETEIEYTLKGVDLTKLSINNISEIENIYNI
ncbi:HD domain-containing phosphohydrolase [Candidatus Sulfurimonas baltica]|uniref:Response regulator n=1 Tax=Candidatus Sulfurimonas baltica TaxID=2740404 RepID=A0A7S7LUE9_9BACT|nr:HD domain-containing phosphohydrolase [Candidatus Sulfurimonas baltica]QOY51661.1 response regulator [Candidatus Sulfurimonas baltica]